MNNNSEHNGSSGCGGEEEDYMFVNFKIKTIVCLLKAIVLF